MNRYRRVKNYMGHKLNNFLFLLKYGSYVTIESGAWVEPAVHIKPFYKNANKLKVVLKARAYIKINTIIQGSGYFELGEHSYISSFCVIGVNEKIIIGRDVMIADSVSLRDTDHMFDSIDIPMRHQGIKTAPIVIEDNVWIGHGAVITKGVTIGTGSIIGANAVVTNNVPPHSVCAGVPAKVIKSRLNRDA